jgi:hypothetical protein
MSVSNNVNVDIHDDFPILSEDLLWGADAIAAELNLTRRQVFHQLATGRLPAKRQSGKWVASRVGLRRYFASIIAGEISSGEVA